MKICSKGHLTGFKKCICGAHPANNRQFQGEGRVQVQRHDRPRDRNGSNVLDQIRKGNYRALALLVLFALLSATANADLILCYSGNPSCANEAAWTAQVATAGLSTTPIETFTGALLDTTGVAQVGGPLGSIQNDMWRDATLNNATATPPNTPLKTSEFFYQNPTPAAVWGFGANFNTAPGQANGFGGHASGITVTIGGTQLVNLRFVAGDFFGVIATDPADRFTSFVLGTVPSCGDGSPACTGWEIFDMDNLRWAVDRTPRETEVPEPASFGSVLTVMLLAVFVGLIRRNA